MKTVMGLFSLILMRIQRRKPLKNYLEMKGM